MVQWLRMQVLGMEVPGPNSGKFFSLNIFFTPFLPHGDCSIRISRSRNFTRVWSLRYNFVAVTLAIQTSKRHCYDDQPIYTPIFKLSLYSVYPVAVTEVRSFFT